MKRTAGIALVAVLLSMTIAFGVYAAGGPIVIRWGNVYAPDQPFNVAIRHVAELVKERSNGELQIQLFPASQLGTNTEMMAQLVQGSLQMYQEGGGFLSQWAPKYLIAEAVYAFRDRDHMFRVMNGPLGQEMHAQLLQTRGVRVLDVWYYGTRHLTANRPIRTPADLRGVKLRVPDGPLYVANGQALGATPVPMTLSEVYLALKTGVIDAEENPIPTIAGFKFYEVQKYLILTGHNVNPNMIMINERFWQSLSPRHQQILLDAIQEGGRLNTELTSEAEQKLLEEFRAVGMTIIEPDLKAFREQAGKAIVASFEGRWGKGFYERVQQSE